MFFRVHEFPPRRHNTRQSETVWKFADGKYWDLIKSELLSSLQFSRIDSHEVCHSLTRSEESSGGTRLPIACKRDLIISYIRFCRVRISLKISITTGGSVNSLKQFHKKSSLALQGENSGGSLAFKFELHRTRWGGYASNKFLLRKQKNKCSAVVSSLRALPGNYATGEDN